MAAGLSTGLTPSLLRVDVCGRGGWEPELLLLVGRHSDVLTLLCSNFAAAPTEDEDH